MHTYIWHLCIPISIFLDTRLVNLYLSISGGHSFSFFNKSKIIALKQLLPTITHSQPHSLPRELCFKSFPILMFYHNFLHFLSSAKKIFR